MLKLQALEEGQEFEFEVEVDNVIHPGLTTVIVRGPDVDGVLASITATIASNGCSIVKLDAGLRGDGATVLEDMFIIRNRATGRAVNNDELGDLARTILAAARDPLNTHSLKGQIDSLEVENIALAERILMLESNLENRQIKIVKDGNDKGKE
jgi:formyltetrahydrofolate hydrolase